MEHTPGPWKLDIQKSGGDWSYFIRQDKATAGPGIQVASCNKFLRNPEENAALISAAPDMLAALDTVLFAVTDDRMTNDGVIDHVALYELVKPLVAKARGQ